MAQSGTVGGGAGRWVWTETPTFTHRDRAGSLWPQAAGAHPASPCIQRRQRLHAGAVHTSFQRGTTGHFSRAWARQAVLPISTRSQVSFGGEKAVGCQATNQRLQPPRSLLGSPAFLPSQKAQGPHWGRSRSNSRSSLVPQTCLPSTAPSQMLLHWNLVGATSSHFTEAETEPWGKTVSSIHLEGGPFSHPCSTLAVAAGPLSLFGRGGD